MSTHDAKLLSKIRGLIENETPKEISKNILKLLEKNENWRGRECINLVAAEAPTSPMARKVLSSEVGIRIGGGHIGRSNRYYTGMDIIDELEATCIEGLKKLFNCNYADHRALSGMHSCQIAYASLVDSSDSILTIPPQGGGDTSNQKYGPPGVRGLSIYDIPFNIDDCSINMDKFKYIAEKVQPKLISLGQTMALFPFPLKDIAEIIKPWDGKIYFDAAHQAGLIAANKFQNPLDEGCYFMTGSSGKTFSGPQGGLVLWNDHKLTEKVSNTIFPVLTGSHQINRVASLAITITELLEYGSQYMGQIIKNSKKLALELYERGFDVLFQSRGFTETHQIMLNVSNIGSGEFCARLLEESNIIANKMPIPTDTKNTKEPSGIRIGVTEVTRLGMKESDMSTIADFFEDILLKRKTAERYREIVRDFRSKYQSINYCHKQQEHI